MLHNEARNLLVEAYEKTHDAKGERKRVLGPEAYEQIAKTVDEQPDIQAVGELLRAAGADVLYLPPYSPDLNPIEKLWSKVKAVLRKLRARSPHALDAAIPIALDCASPEDWAGWFRHAGYCLF